MLSNRDSVALTPSGEGLESGDDHQQIVQEQVRNLYQNTDFLSAVFEKLVSHAIIAADFDGNIIAYNEGAKQTYGYAPEEAIGRMDFSAFYQKAFIEQGGLQRLTDELMKNGHAEFRGEKLRKNGEPFPAKSTLTLTRDRDGKVVGFIEIVQDVTEFQREFTQMEDYAHPPARVTSRMFGQPPLSECNPMLFQEYVEDYRQLLQKSIEQELYRHAQADISEQLRQLAERLGFLRAGPRDAVDLHTEAIKAATAGSKDWPDRAYIEIGRMLLLELLGYLVAYYRNRNYPGQHEPAAGNIDTLKE